MPVLWFGDFPGPYIGAAALDTVNQLVLPQHIQSLAYGLTADPVGCGQNILGGKWAVGFQCVSGNLVMQNMVNMFVLLHSIIFSGSNILWTER